MEVLQNKNIMVMGIRNKKSIAWGIAKRAYEEGARLILTYETEKEKETIEELTKNFTNHIILKCNVADDKQVENLFIELKKDSLKLLYKIGKALLSKHNIFDE